MKREPRVGENSFIYTLSDASGIKYVGQTANKDKRYAQHSSLAQNRGSKNVNKWLFELLSTGQRPQMNIIEITQNADEREKYWIAYYRNIGISLLNMTEGGKDAMSHVHRAKLNNPWGKTHSPVQRRLKSISETIKHFKKSGNSVLVGQLTEKLIAVNAFLKVFGLKKANNILYLKYGK